MDPANVPAHAVTGAPVVVRHDAVVAVFDVATDAGVMRVTCVAVDSSWLVTTIEPRRPYLVPAVTPSDRTERRP